MKLIVGRFKKTSGRLLVAATTRNEERCHCRRDSQNASQRGDTLSVLPSHNPTFGAHVRFINNTIVQQKLGKCLFSKPAIFIEQFNTDPSTAINLISPNTIHLSVKLTSEWRC